MIRSSFEAVTPGTALPAAVASEASAAIHSGAQSRDWAVVDGQRLTTSELLQSGGEDGQSLPPATRAIVPVGGAATQCLGVLYVRPSRHVAGTGTDSAVAQAKAVLRSVVVHVMDMLQRLGGLMDAVSGVAQLREYLQEVSNTTAPPLYGTPVPT